MGRVINIIVFMIALMSYAMYLNVAYDSGTHDLHTTALRVFICLCFCYCMSFARRM
nr:MAG TPA: hypothetical protein [Caudoviricetes sp.]